MIRILQVLPRLRRGGSQTMVMNLYRVLDRKNYQFDFIIFTPDHDDYYDEIISLGGKVYHFKKFNGINLFDVRKEWNYFFIDHPEYKILHSHVRSFASIYISIAKKQGVITIIHSHSTSNGKGFEGVVKSVLEYPLRYQADYLFACSTEAGKWLFGKNAILKGNYRFIANAININEFEYSILDRMSIRQKYGICFETVIGHVGGFETPKNHVFLIECFNDFLKLNPNSILLLVGNGTYEEAIKAKCKDLLIDNKVIFAGLQANVSSYLSAMDIFLFPSLWEGLPVSVVEAQASGLPCLLSDTITRDVELTNLLEYYSLSEGATRWAEKLRQMIPDSRKKASEINLKKLDIFDCNRTIRKLELFYSECSKKVFK